MQILLATALSIGFCLHALGQHAPQRPTDAATGYIAGRVIDSQGTPVRSAVVTLRIDGSAEQVRVLSNQDGRFAFQRVSPGTYRVEASRTGHSGASYGRFAPEMPARVVTVAKAESHTDVQVTLFRNAVVAGRVVGESGQPLSDVPVRLVYTRPHPRVPGIVVFAVWPSTVTTDDQGTYRFSAPAGRFTVLVGSPAIPDGASPITGHAPLLTGDGDLLRTSAPTFHPSTTSLREAALYDVRPGEVKDNVDVRLVATGATRVSGRAIAPAPWPTGTSVRLLADFGDAMTIEDPREVGRSPLTSDGTFNFAGIPSGTYRLRLISPPAGRAMWLDHAVTITGPETRFDAPVDTGVRITGRAMFIGDKGPSAADLARTTVSFLPLGGPSVPPASIRLGNDLGFTAGPYPAGRYFAEATPPPGWSLREVRIGDTDASRVPVTLPAGVVEDVTFVFVNSVSTLEGRVESPADWMRTLVLVFPETHATEPVGIFRGRRRRAVPLEADGTFRFTDVPAGDYLVVAAPAEIGLDWQMPASLKLLAAQATRVRVGEGQSPSVTIPGRRPR